MKLFIKYMVSLRCIIVVKEQLTKLGLHFDSVEMGVVDTVDELTEQQREHLKQALLEYELELMDDKKAILIERIKNTVIQMVHFTDELQKCNFSDYLSQTLNYDYTYLSNTFSESQGITIESFIIAHKIERVKELLIYDEINITEIAWKMHYSSVAHLSNQFKKVTGLTPSQFKSLKVQQRKPIEHI